MKKRIALMFILLLTAVISGCTKPAPEPEPETDGPICGGNIDNSNNSAPKKIRSKELTHFYNRFFLYARQSYEQDSGYSFEAVKNEDGTVSIEEKQGEGVSCVTDGQILDDLQKIIEKYGLAKMNGTDKHTAGLPYEFQPSYFSAEYESGETLYFSINNDPESAYEREIRDLFANAFAAQGEDCFMPPAEALELTRFDLEFTNGDIQYRYGELLMPLEGVDKSFEEVAEYGYEDGEYYTVIEKQQWDRTTKTLPFTIYREATPEYYEGLKEVLKDAQIENYANDKSFPTDFDYSGTPQYYEFYIEYAYGNNLYGFSDGKEEYGAFTPAAKAIAAYIDEYINEDPTIR